MPNPSGSTAYYNGLLGWPATIWSNSCVSRVDLCDNFNWALCNWLNTYLWQNIRICKCIWVWSRNCDCIVTWFCYQLIAKPGNKTVAVSWPDPYTCIWYRKLSTGLFTSTRNPTEYNSRQIYLLPRDNDITHVSVVRNMLQFAFR